jgi:hypothetical protein
MPEKWDPAKAAWVDAFENAPPERRRRGGLLVPIVAGLLVMAISGFLLSRGEGGKTGPTVSVQPEPTSAPSYGITQTQLDRLGDSISARYRSGDTEVAQALLDNFMDAHPECVSAVMAAGEGKMRDVVKSYETVADYLRSTAPYPNSYTTLVTNREDGVVRGAALGVSCKEGE